MTVRNIIKIDEEKCTGCGECVPACAEGAIEIVDGVAKLKADNLCDGLGACLGDCPEGAISIEVRDAEAFDEAAVSAENRSAATEPEPATPRRGHGHATGGCPGSRVLQLDRAADPRSSAAGGGGHAHPSALRQWPIQLHLVPPTAPYFHKADVVLAADCVAFSMGAFHQDWLADHALAIACPKLDTGQEAYMNKLVAMIDKAEINTLTVMIMEVPCCGSLLRLAQAAVSAANRKVPIKHVVVGLQGNILSESWT